MSLPSVLKRCAAVLAAAVIASSGISTASAQSALPFIPGSSLGAPAPGPGTQMVVFGDSFTANGGAGGDRRVGSEISWQQNCVSDNENWAHVAARTAGLKLADYSCNGTGMIRFPTYVETAISQGDVGPATEQVVIMYGVLDLRTSGDTIYRSATNGTSPYFSGYYGAVQQAVSRIRSTAPNATITLANYPRITEGDMACFGDFAGLVPGSSVPPGNVVIPGSGRLVGQFNGVIADTAHRVGANFVDVYSASAGHSPCADPSQRWTNLFQDHDPASVMMGHPTDQGHQAIGQLIGQLL